jgi:transcriptional regulator with XRE-family HTH domain
MMDRDLEPLDAEAERLLELLSRLGDEALLGDATVEALEAHCAALPVSTGLKSRLARMAREAEADLEFEAALEKRRQRATLGAYLAFLRGKTEWTVSETAKRVRLEFQWLADLERDALSPALISARKLADLLKRLKGSLEMAERLLPSTIQAARFVSATGRNSLYRRGSPTSQGRWSEPPDAPETRENPEYQEQAEALEQLREQLRAAVRNR